MLGFLVVGGRQKPGMTEAVAEWHHYAAGLVATVWPESRTARVEVEHVTPPEVCAAHDDPSITFKSATLCDGRLFVPTQTEVLTYEVPSFRPVGYLSLPCFNDVHHARPGAEGSILVVNTGLDMVIEVGADGTVRREWSVDGETPWTRFSRAVDYRKVVSTKPHRCHPNHVWWLDGEIWATRCDQGDAVCLTREHDPIAVAEWEGQWIHDGLVHDGAVYFTTVDGQIVVVDGASRTVRNRYDLKAIVGGTTPLGWCRGLAILPDHHVAVGFSRLRPTRWRRAVQWAKQGMRGRGRRATRIAVFDLAREKLVWQLSLEPVGVNAIFSVHAAELQESPA